ncbi:Myb-like DNA-binding domain-containing protein [Penicillium ucsense]|uniref:Myb-like DNA-binding domain-containing protein n=1 Tax=Penicillium ucsense TaxID=2839758 RepID=A0A8J8W6S5_9EURO|nr:Myb-like DNA-binding domain-containing protein [Penicillium ucsense]KAF7737173.1 Myb-like DNA-binding domain-containing protein [Penicillium ucsense]
MSLTNPSRRVTRSQSRELEDASNIKQSSLLKNEQRAPPSRAQFKNLSPVVERSPVRTTQAVASQLSASIVPDTPARDEGHTNFSGTTFLAQDQDNGPGSARSAGARVDAMELADELPDLQQASSRLLEFFNVNSSKAGHICKAAERVGQPIHDDHERFKRVYRKLADSMKVFTKEGFIDVASISQLIPSVTVEGTSGLWEAAPYIYRANCAWLLLSILSVEVSSKSQARLIANLNEHFPLPFMSPLLQIRQKLSSDTSEERQITIDLAVEIRTQHLIAEIERRKDEKNFDARSVLNEIFYRVPASARASSTVLDEDDLRGFNFPGAFENDNGSLPEDLQEKVSLRVEELLLRDTDEGFDLNELKTSFKWSLFCLRVVRFVQRREQEFKIAIASYPNIDEVHGLVIKAIKRRANSNAADSPSRSVLDDSAFGSPSATLNDTPTERARPREIGKKDLVSSNAATQNTFQETLLRPPASQMMDPKPVVSTTKDPYRRKSTKNKWRNPAGLAELSFLTEAFSSGRHGETGLLQARSSRLEETERSVLAASPGGLGITADRDEIAWTPEPEQGQEPESASHQPELSQRPVSASSSREDHTLQRSEFDFEVTQPHEADMSASPRGSERIKRISHRPRPFFASPTIARERHARQGRSLLDPQPTASKIFFSPGDSDDSHCGARHREPSKQPATQIMSASQAGSRKRGRGDSDDDSTGDDDDNIFDQDTRTHDVSARRAQIPARVRHSDKRQRTNVESLRGSIELIEAPTMATRQSQRSRDVSQENPSPQRPRQESRWRAENSVSGGPSSSRPIAPFVGGRRWSQEEDDRLLMLMATYGTQWATIERQDQICPPCDGGPKLERRTQVNMKDRARTLKLKYIRNGLPLPPGFDRVTG